MANVPRSAANRGGGNTGLPSWFSARNLHSAKISKQAFPDIVEVPLLIQPVKKRYCPIRSLIFLPLKVHTEVGQHWCECSTNARDIGARCCVPELVRGSAVPSRRVRAPAGNTIHHRDTLKEANQR